MVPELIQLTSPIVNWEQFLSESNQLLDRSVTSSLERKRTPIGDLGSFIGTLAEFQKESSDPEDAVRIQRFRNHIWFSFMIVADHSFEYTLNDKNLSILRAGGKNRNFVAILSGTLTQWQEVIEEGLKETSAYDERILYGKIYLWMSSQGLARLWGPKQDIGDGTFILR